MDFPILLLVIIGLAFIFDYINGFHDAANSIATIVSTKVLTPFQAVVWAAFFNFVAFLIFKDHSVANTIGKTVFKEYITLHVILAGLIAAIIWNLLTWWYGIPSSSSHTLIGGFAGSAITHAILVAYQKGTDIPALSNIIDSGKVWQIVAFIFLAPLIGMLISMIFTFITIHKNIWVKTGWLLLACVGIWFGFKNFEQDKISENVSKYFKTDKYTHEVSKLKLEIEALKNHNDPKLANDIAEKQEKLADQQAKLDQAKANAATLKPIAIQFEDRGEEPVLNDMMKAVDYNPIWYSRIADKLGVFMEMDKKAGQAEINPSYAPTYKKEKAFYDDVIKPMTKRMPAEGFDKVSVEIFTELKKANYDIGNKSLADMKEAISVDVKKDISKELHKGDNKVLRFSLIGIMVLFILTFFYNHFRRDGSAVKTANTLKRLQLVSSAAFSIGHGGNDAQKVMGIIAAALVSAGQITDIKQMPDWVPLSCYVAIALGTLSGGWKIIKTMGTKITKVSPLEGVCAETAGATTLFVTEQMGIPVSTTHTITGSIIGVGATKRLSAVRWGVTINLLWAWILTIPISAIIAGLVYLVVQYF